MSGLKGGEAVNGKQLKEKKGSKEEEARETLSPLFSVFLALLSAFLG